MEVVRVQDYWPLVLRSRQAPYVGLISRIPPRLWREFMKAQKELMAVDDRQIYADPSTLHITIKGLGFLGEDLTDERIEEIFGKTSEIISGFRPFEVEVKGLGVFPTAIHAKVNDPTGELHRMNTELCDKLGVEISNYDKESYIPHVTLATFNTSDVDPLLGRVEEVDLREYSFGIASVLEIEAVEVRMHLALGATDLQRRAFSYLRSFHLC